MVARITPCLENGKTALVDGLPDGVTAHGSTEYIVISGKHGVSDSRFAYYLARSPEFRRYAIARMEGTSGRQRVPTSAIERYQVGIPTLREQQRIAAILGALDDKIEINRRMNVTLEAMARALFRSWFVDFDPVRAKVSPDVPRPLGDLFPDSFADSDLGQIPQGWAPATLGDVTRKPEYGYTASANFQPVGPKFVRITDLNKQPWIEWSAVPYCEIGAAAEERYQVHPGDLLIARMADPGHAAMIEEPVRAVFASYLIRFRPLSNLYARYLQYWTRSPAYWDLVLARGLGTTRTTLNAQVLRGFPLLLPPRSLVTAFDRHVGILRARLVSSVRESQVLATVRDALLPKLMSGDVRVQDAEALLEAAPT